MTLTNEKQSVHCTAQVGDIVCLYWVTFSTDDPWSKFKLPALFKIEKVIGNYKYAFQHIETGEIIEDDVSKYSTYAEYMYRPEDVFDDLQYRRDKEKKYLEESIHRIKIERDLLKQILVAQGTRIVTNEQAQKLGLISEKSR